MTRNRIIGIVAAATAITSMWGWYYHRARAAESQLLATEDVIHSAAQIGDINLSVASTGLVISNLDVAIKCRASGQIIKFPYDVSDHVKKGDLLVQLDPSDEQPFVDQAGAEVAISQARLAEAKLNAQVADLDLQTATEKADADITAAQVKATNLRNTADRQQHAAGRRNWRRRRITKPRETDAAQADADLQAASIAKEELKSQAVALA